MSAPACSQKSVVEAEAKQKPTSMHKFKMLSPDQKKGKTRRQKQRYRGQRKKISNKIHKHESAITHRQPKTLAKTHTKTHRRPEKKIHKITKTKQLLIIFNEIPNKHVKANECHFKKVKA